MHRSRPCNIEENSLGPEDDFGRARGGNISLVGNAEVIIPVPFLAEFKSVRLSGFLDAGNVYGKDTVFFQDQTTGLIFGVERDDEFNLSDLRMSLGVSGIWMSPFGLLSVSFAQPFRDQAGDELQKFQFNFGTQF